MRIRLGLERIRLLAPLHLVHARTERWRPGDERRTVERLARLTERVGVTAALGSVAATTPTTTIASLSNGWRPANSAMDASGPPTAREVVARPVGFTLRRGGRAQCRRYLTDAVVDVDPRSRAEGSARSGEARQSSMACGVGAYCAMYHCIAARVRK